MWRQIKQAQFEEYGDIKRGIDEFNKKDHEEKWKNFYLPVFAHVVVVLGFFLPVLSFR